MGPQAIATRQPPGLIADTTQASAGTHLRFGAEAPRRAVLTLIDLLILIGVVVCVPIVILALGLPIALFVQLLLWILRLL
jgi:hypothetical protein